MTPRSARGRLIGTVLIVLGVAVLIAAGAMILREGMRRGQTLAQLEERAAAPASTTTATATPAPSFTPTESPSPSPSSTSFPVASLSPTLTQPSPSATAPAAVIATATPLPPTATPAPPTPTPAPTSTATSTRTPAKIVRIRAPAIDLDAPVVEIGWKLVEENGQMRSEWETASYAAGHHQNSALPGQGGNVVLSGHHNIEGEVFKRVVELEAGDQIVLETEDGRTYVYQVVETMILAEAGASEEQRRANAQYIAPTEDERLTLVTCWPYWTNTHRVIVIARPAPAP